MIHFFHYFFPDKLEQDCPSLHLKLQSASKRHKKELEEAESCSLTSALKDFDDRLSGFKKKVQEAEKLERDALRSLHEREELCDQLKQEVKSLTDASDQLAETIGNLEQSLADARNR